MTIKEHNDNIRTVIKSCNEAIKGKWELIQGSSETNEGFECMITLLEDCIIKADKIELNGTK